MEVSTRSFQASIRYAIQSTRLYYKRAALQQKEPLFLGLWVAWLVTGSLYYGYAPDFELGLVKGFYMAINIGYSIGFGYPMDKNSPSIWFSTFFVLIGASFVGVALGFFAEKITQDSESWFSTLQDQKKIEDFILLNNETWKGRVKAWIYGQRSAVRAVLLWLAFVLVLIIVGLCGVPGWTYKEAQYFAISTLSTGGHWMIPEDSPLWLYGVTGVLTMFGVPIMALAMAAIGQALMDQGSLAEAKAAINAPITKDELLMLEDLGLQDGDGKIDLSEFILLCMVRSGTDPGLLTYTRQRFKELSVENQEFLTIEEITQSTCVFMEGSVRRKESVKHMQHPNGMDNCSNENESMEADPHNLDSAKQDHSNSESKRSSEIPSHRTGTRPPPLEETEATDIEEAPRRTETYYSTQLSNQPNRSRQHTQSIVLQPRYDDLNTIPRPLKRSDDMGMALLDRSYVMSANEEKQLLEEGRRRSKLILEYSREDSIGWSSKGKIAGVKIFSKESIDGSPINVVKGVAEMAGAFSYDFLASQFRYEMRNGDSWHRYYRMMDPLLVQTTKITSVGCTNNLLDEGRYEHCHIIWVALSLPGGLVCDRDACIIGHSHLVECPVTGDPVFLVQFFSITHSSVPGMERALGRVRGDVKMGGYIVRPSTVDNEHHQVTYLIQYDPKGSLPVAATNAFSISQGLNAGRYRDLLLKQYRMGLKLNKVATPFGGYNMKRRESAVHELQLMTEEKEDLCDLFSARTFEFELNVLADSPITMTVVKNGGDGNPLPFSLARKDKSDQLAKKLAVGSCITFQQVFKTSLLITVDGPLPKSLALRFQNTFWRPNTLYIPAVLSLTAAPPPDSSQGSRSIR